MPTADDLYKTYLQEGKGAAKNPNAKTILWSDEMRSSSVDLDDDYDDDEVALPPAEQGGPVVGDAQPKHQEAGQASAKFKGKPVPEKSAAERLWADMDENVTDGHLDEEQEHRYSGSGTVISPQTAQYKADQDLNHSHVNTASIVAVTLITTWTLTMNSKP